MPIASNPTTMPATHNNETVQAYAYLRNRSEAENETALEYFNTRIRLAHRKRIAMSWLVEALPMMEQGSRTASEILSNIRKQKP